jgi:hypothetical protein
VSVPGRAAYYGNGVGWGYSYTMPSVLTCSNYAYNKNIITQAGNSEAVVRNSTWKNIETATIDIHNKMNKKYGVNFE